MRRLFTVAVAIGFVGSLLVAGIYTFGDDLTAANHHLLWAVLFWLIMTDTDERESNGNQ